MNDTRTPQEKYTAWINAVIYCDKKGWKNVEGWEFKSPSGSIHDLSAADLNKLDKIEKDKSFIVN